MGRELAALRGRLDEGDAAHDAAFAYFVQAFPYGSARQMFRNYRMGEAGQAAAEAAQAIVVGESLSKEAFADLTAAMRAAGVAFTPQRR